MRWKLPLVLVVVAAGAAFVSLNSWAKSQAKDVWGRLAAATVLAQTTIDHSKSAAVAPLPPAKPWDGYIHINDRESQSIGLAVVEVKPQVEPMRLEVNGNTAYDPNTQSKVRPKFPSLIDKVYVEQGQRVEKGDPLVDVFSADLAAAKSEYEKKMAQWEHDKKELDRNRKLFENQMPAISQKEFLNSENDEKQSRLAAKLARDYLIVYGLTESEIDQIKNESGTQKAKMTLRAPASGVVITRDVVQGNRYEITDVLLVIAPLDHFWVWGNVYPSDASRVEIGQNWIIYCTFLGQTIKAKVESITSDIDKDSKTVRIRTRIDNRGGRMKADMLVSGVIEIPPSPSRTIIPRQAMVSTDGADYAFVRLPGKANEPDTFERRQIRVIQEYHDQVIVADGLKPGEHVATKGSLLLSQMYEDAATLETGASL